MSDIKIARRSCLIIPHMPCIARPVDRKQDLAFTVHKCPARTPTDIPKVTFADLQLGSYESRCNDHGGNSDVHPLSECCCSHDYLRGMFCHEFFQCNPHLRRQPVAVAHYSKTSRHNFQRLITQFLFANCVKEPPFCIRPLADWCV